MNAYLLPSLDFGPSIIQRLIAAMPPADFDRPSAPGRFTPREVVAHLADWEPIMRDRIRTAIDHPGSTIESFDEARMAIDHDYAHTDIFAQARLFQEQRKETTTLVSSLTPDDRQKAVVHPERGTQTAEDLANLLLGHDLYHIEQLSAFLADKIVSTW